MKIKFRGNRVIFRKSPGLVPPGLVPPGLVSPRLVPPGLVSPGLVSPGLVSPGLVSPGLVSPAPRLGLSRTGLARLNEAKLDLSPGLDYSRQGSSRLVLSILVLSKWGSQDWISRGDTGYSRLGISSLGPFKLSLLRLV